MFVFSFFTQVDIGLIADIEFMTSVSSLQFLGVVLIAVAHHSAVKASSDEKRQRVVMAVGEPAVHHLLVVHIDKAPCDIYTIDHHVCTHDEGRLYC